MADMTRGEAINILAASDKSIISETMLTRAYLTAIAEMKRVEELEAENKRLKAGIEKVIAEIEELADKDFIVGTYVEGASECLYIINKCLGE